jgi:hypothetical protein
MPGAFISEKAAMTKSGKHRDAASVGNFNAWSNFKKMFL